tara:strand:+ start:536 stop:1264 length:729 start_codon:yes stop_codon:yes gene_type:complete
MTNKKKILCIIPARSGSKRIKNKNLLKLSNKTLVELAYQSAKESKIFKNIFVSTDKLKVAKNLPWIKRSKKLSGSKSDISDVIHECLLKSELMTNTKFDYVVCLQPTSPLRNALLIRKLVKNVIKYKANGGITGVRIVPWNWKIVKNHGFNSWYPKNYPRSQEFKKTIFWQEINTVQVASRKAIIEKKRWDLPLYLQLIPSYASIDIDVKKDFKKTKNVYSKLMKLLNEEKFLEGNLIKKIN